MTFMENQKLCFAFNIKEKECRCLDNTYCNGNICNMLNCKFYKARDDIKNNQKMKGYLKNSKNYENDKTIYDNEV